MSKGNSANEVTITVQRRGFIGNLINQGQQLLTKVADYGRAITNVFYLVKDYNAGKDPNAFHKLLQAEYAKVPNDKLKVLTIPVLAPSTTQVYERIVAIGNPILLKALRQIPRAETTHPSYFETHPQVPKINGGRAFGSVLEAIGMGILSAESHVHNPFINEMISTLTIKSIVQDENQSTDKKVTEADSKSTDTDDESTYNKLNSRFVKIIKEETTRLISSIRAASESGELCNLDFRFYALKIFLRGFYPNAYWNDTWINALSHEIEKVSDLAFKCMVDPRADLEELRQEAKRRLDPFIDKVMSEDQSSYLRPDYVKNTDKEILRQIIVSLLFAGGDNIKKFLDHVFIEFGNDAIRENYLKKTPAKSDLQTMITEVGRLYTTIYAQPGEALEDFVMEYRGEKIYIKAGDKLHYTTFEANRDEQEWGPFANEFNPEENKKHYNRLPPLATFGDGSRVCRGKSVTLAIIEYFVSQALNEFRWEARVDGKKNYHPTEFNFNNGVPGNVQFVFSKVKKPVLEREVTSVTEKEIVTPNWRASAANQDGVASQVGKFKLMTGPNNDVEELSSAYTIN